MRTLVLTAVLATFLLGCGRPGEPDALQCALCGARNDIRGSIAALNGSQAQMAAWVIASFEKDTGISRVNEVDAAGLFTLSQLRTEKPQTLALYSPDYILQAVLAIPNDKTANTVKQFINIKSPNLPRIINKGAVMTFQDYNGITLTKDLAADQDGNGIPDGYSSIDGDPSKLHLDSGLALQTAGKVDLDQDGTFNDKDPDIDGDGVINWLDPDDDGDSIRDAFDGDANGDLVNDAAAGQAGAMLDQYFKEGIEFVAVQFTTNPKSDGTGDETSLTFTTKVRPDVTPLAVQIRGAPSLLNGANYISRDDPANPIPVAWNRLLADDGKSEDSSAGDRIFAKKVVLNAGMKPRPNESIFFQLVFGSTEKPWYMEFSFTFPDLTPRSIEAQYTPNGPAGTGLISLLKNPFEDSIQDFIWTVNVFDAADKIVWQSTPQTGATRQLSIPLSIIVAGQTYKYTVTAQTLDKVPGYPTFTVTTQKYNLQ